MSNVTSDSLIFDELINLMGSTRFVISSRAIVFLFVLRVSGCDACALLHPFSVNRGCQYVQLRHQTYGL